MARFLKSRKKSYGLMPGSLVFIGNRKMEKSIIHLFMYNKNEVTERVVDRIEDVPEIVPEGYIMWINIYGLQDTEMIGKAGERFLIPSLDLEDVLNTDQRPKITGEDEDLTFFLKVL